MGAPPIGNFTSPLQSLVVANLIVTNYANLPGGGGGSGNVQAEIQYTATGAENPAGFVLSWPSALSTLPNVVNVQCQGLAAGNLGAQVDAPKSLWTLTGLTVRAARALVAGETIVVTAFD